jgi:CRP/FNR family transcriptional regulator, cyclic AMP receptor protein
VPEAPGSSSSPQAARPAETTSAKIRAISFVRMSKLRGRDSNPNYQSQNLACCQLHHPATGGAQYRRADRERLPSRVGALPLQVRGSLAGGRREPRGRMPEGGSGSIQLLEADPELARGLDPRRVREVSQRLFVRAVSIPRGSWSPGRTLMEGSQPIGLLVLEGLLVREATVSDHPSAELLGPGDLLRAWEDRDAEVLLPRSVRWSALTNARVAVIDHALAVRAAQWPEIFASLVERAARRAERLVIMQAIGHLTRVDDRLLALLWCLAERWGRVVPGGVLVSLRLPHRTLAGMVGARRPSVTTALGQLMARGAIERRPDGGWLLRGEPPKTADRDAAVRLPKTASL